MHFKIEGSQINRKGLSCQVYVMKTIHLLNLAFAASSTVAGPVDQITGALSAVGARSKPSAEKQEFFLFVGSGFVFSGCRVRVNDGHHGQKAGKQEEFLEHFVIAVNAERRLILTQVKS